MTYSGAFFGVEVLEQRCLMSATPALGGLSAAASTGGTYYVSPSGSTSNNGTQSSPWPSVNYALSQVGGGNTVVLEPGNYGLMWIPACYSGSAANPTIVRSQYPWQAVIDGQGTDSGFQVEEGGQYVDVYGLQIRNCLYSGISMDGSHNVISGNWVSHCGRSGIQIAGGGNNLIQGNLSEYNGTDYYDGGGISVSGDHETIIGNVIRHNDFIGIAALAATNDVISGNLVYDQDDRSGMEIIAAGSSSGNSVTNNTLLHDKTVFENGLGGVQTYSGNVIVSDASTAALDQISSGQVSQYSQVNPAWFSPDTVVPTASLVSSTVNFMDQYMVVTVLYKDNVGINTSSLGNGNLTLSGPNGYQQTAVLTSWTRNANGVLAVYNFCSPGAIWDAQDNGAYTLSMQSMQVADDGGPANYVLAGSLGRVTVGLTNRSIYVSPTGLTTNNGTQNSPFPSVAYALSVVGGGQTIILEPGTYSPILVPRGDGGTSAHPTVIQSQYKWQAVIDGSLNPAMEGLASEDPGAGGTTNYVTFDGLKVENAGSFGIDLGGDWNVAQNCWVTGSESDGIGSWGHSHVTVQNNLVEYNGTSTQFSHGIYMKGSWLVVTGNIVRHSSACGISLTGLPSAPSIDSGNLVYGNLQNLEYDGQTGSDTVTNNILLATTDISHTPSLCYSVDEIRDYGPGAFGVWSGNRVESTVSGASLDSIDSNNVADYSKALSLILPPQAAALDRTAPVASVSDSGLDGSLQTVWVTYTDNQSLNLSKINSNNIVIKGPGGYSAPAQAIAMMRMPTNSHTLLVEYDLTAPRGGWTSANNGKYTVSLQSNQISDLSGNYTPAGTISGGFNITITTAPQSALKATAPNSGSVSPSATTVVCTVPVQGFSGGLKAPAVTTSPTAPPLAVSQALSKAVLGSFAKTTTGSAQDSTEVMDLLPTLLPLSL
jgi:hypothetical protein